MLYELATEGRVSRWMRIAALGESLILPPWLEPRRGEIEAVLPPLRPPT